MNSDSKLSFVNGIIAGAGAVLAIMSVAFIQMVSPLEGVMGFTTTEIRVAVLLGGIVCAVAVGYEFYGKKETKEQEDKRIDQGTKDIIQKKEPKAESSDE